MKYTGGEQGDRVLRYIKDRIEQNLVDGEVFCRENADIFYLYSRDTDRDRLEIRLKKDHGRGVQSRRRQILGVIRSSMCCGAAIPTEDDDENSFDQMMSHVMLALVRATD